VGGYDESFLTFSGIPSLPSGWSAIASVGGYVGDWGTDSAGGFRGPEASATVGVLGYQHTGSTGIVTVNLAMTNDTGAEINALEVSYLGRTARADQGRYPVWTFGIDGVEVPSLSYSTFDGIDELVSATITGLSIGVGETFTLSWSSDRGAGAGSSRQIGIADVSVEAVTIDVEPPVFAVAPGTYFEDQTVFISNFGGYAPTVEVRYTLDGSDPAVGVGSIYDNVTGILVADGSGSVQLRAIAVDTDSSLVSPIVSSTYIFPTNVANIAGFLTGTPGALYRVTSEAVVLHRDSFRNRHFVRDNSGSLTIWDDTSLLTTSYSVSDGVTGFIGRPSLKNSGAFIAMDVAADAGAATSTGNATDPVVVTLDDLDLSYTGNLVRINGVTISEMGNLATGTNYTVTNVDGSAVLRTDFFGADYIGDPIPNTTIDIIAIVGGFGTAVQITPRSSADLIGGGTPGDDFDTWALATGATGGMTGDSDFDGLDNAFEYAFGLNPTSGGSVNPFAVPFNPATGLFTYTRRTQSLTGLSYTYEYSTSLSDPWQSFTPSVTPVTNNGDPVEEITVTVPAALLAEPKLFIRVVTP
jgi:hypothetical protein